MKKNKVQGMTDTSKLPPKVERAAKIFREYMNTLPVQAKTEVETEEEAKKKRKSKGDSIYGDICARSEYLHQQAELLFLLSATSDAGLPEKLDWIFAEMKDKAGEIGELAKQLFDVLTGTGKLESKEE